MPEKRHKSATKAPQKRIFSHPFPCQEFYQQGDIEKEVNGNTSNMFDRTQTSVEQSQIGFINFMRFGGNATFFVRKNCNCEFC